LLPGGHYDFASGTSVATAHVTGIVALLLAKNSRLTGPAVYQLLRDTTVHLEAGGDDSVDACGAVTALIGRGLCHNGTFVGTRVAMH
jgi:subtilisin family serine protease